MIIAEYTLDHPVLRRTLNRVPGIELTWEDSYPGPDGKRRVIVWIESDDYRSVDTAMGNDPTIANPAMLTEAGGRRLYRFDLVGEGAQTSIMPVLSEVGGVHQGVTATNEGWRNRSRFPNREAFERVYRFCRDHEIDFTFNSLYEESELLGPTRPDLSEAQFEILVEAVESGYLEIPRQSSLEELGGRLGISESAASERFRRGVKKLVRHSLIR